VTKTETFHIGVGFIVGATVTVLVLLAYALGIIYFTLGSTPRGSPVVRGGSIRGLTNPSWQPCQPGVCSGYWTTVTDNTQLVLSSVGNGINNLSGLKGWTVNFYDRNYDGSVSQNPAVQLCSEKTCSASSLDAGNVVYIGTSNPTGFQVYNPGELRYHNRRNKCDSDNSTEGYCDHLVLVGIIQNNGSSILPEVKYPCGRFFPGRCSVRLP